MINWVSVIAAAFVPLIVGFIWYNPKVMGTKWMELSGVTPESAKESNMVKVFGISLVCSFILAFIIGSIYKYFEIVNSLPAEKMALDKILMVTGFYTSVSENIAGILTAFTFIIYFENYHPFKNKIAAFRRKIS